MTWARFDDQFPIHRKVAPLDDATYRLHTEAVFWCSRNTTDGHIGADELATVSARASKARVAKLIERGLWHAAPYECPSPKCPPTNGAGWVVHDYLEYQPTKEKVKAELAARAERTRLWRERKGGRKPGDTSSDASRDGVSDASGDTSSDASPSPPRPAPKEGGAGAPQSLPAAVVGGAAAGAKSKPKPRSGLPSCPRCGNGADSAYHRNVCLPEFEELSPA